MRSERNHERFMRRALELALKAKGNTSPNPMVGSVVVKNGRIIAEGYHRFAGSVHAEAYALKKAGAKARGADLYVTLEPCCYVGRTPPCVDQIIDSKISRVIIGTKDPNPKVNGVGIRMLKQAGIEVVKGVLEKECEELNFIYNKYISEGKPFVIVKVALSLDGKIAAKDGSSKWITNPESRDAVHLLRSEVDAIMVGSGTATNDDPLLTARIKDKEAKNPIRIVIDGDLEISPELKLFKQTGKTIIIVSNHVNSRKVEPFQKIGAEIIRCKSLKGRLDLREMLEKLGSRGIASVLVEGGAGLHSALIRDGLVDKIIAFISPKILGGFGKDWLPFLKVPSINEALDLKDVKISLYNDNAMIEGNLK